MDVAALVTEAEADGVTFRAVDNQLRIGTPESKEHWQDRLNPHRPEILAHLNGEASADDAPEPPQRIERYRPFPVHTLPGPVREYASASAEAIGCDPSFVALPVLACLARAIGNRRVIRLRRTWTEPAIVWGAIIGKSGSHKSPALQAAMRFLNRLQEETIRQHAATIACYEREKLQHEKDLKAWQRSKAGDPPPEKPAEPVCTRFTTSDCTIEALAALLAVQSDGLLVVRDELAGWLGGIAEYKGGRGSDLGHWLASWSAQPLTVDRKTGAVKMLHVPRAAVSLVGGIQPGVLREAIGREHLQDGLCARLLLAMPEPRAVTWTEAAVDHETEAALAEVFSRLLAMEPGTDDNGEPEPIPLDLTPEAKAVWVEYFNRHRAELANLDDDLAAAWSKLEAYTARFALIFQLVEWAAGDAAAGHEIDETSMRAAIELSDWFGGEARRVYGLFVETSEDREQRELVELIHRKGGKVTPRELARSSRRYRKSGEAEAALERLVQQKLGKWDVESTPGRPRREFVLSIDTTGDGDTSAANAGESGLLSPSPPSPLRNGHPREVRP